ncbi:hypothetical protein PVAP13_5NG110345 [Panicum virgatum]|uniref:Uncharacterized protein n=1 Tax=Panicum virgatum TaxID=38727 RepID=A0A8T0S855_PANVG|nr:hypothetical protein PVAP13_5NG110345 [Panicum virgatum]
MSKLGEVRARSRATADGEIDLRRISPRLMKMKEASASLEAGILKLKEEQKALIDRGKKIRAREYRELEAEALKQGIKVPWTRTQLARAAKNRKAAEEVQPAGARKKRKKVVKTIVPPALVEYMILNPHNPFVDFLEDNQGKTPTIQRSPTTRTAPRRTTVPMTRTTRSGIYVQDPAVRGSVDAVYTLEETSGTDVRRSLSLNPFANVR